MDIRAKVLVVAAWLFLAGCSSVQDERLIAANANVADVSEDDLRDPIEPFNRPIFNFNWKVLDQYILKPIATGYGEYVPASVRTSLLNAALNLEEPTTFVNDLLQFKFKDASISSGRFLINSTVGLLGLFDVADELGLKRKEEDFAQTLGYWGLGHGAYLMLPGMGPSTAKDLTGDIIDATAMSFNLLSWPQSMLKLTIKTLDTRVDLMSQEQLLNDSIDPYLFTKELYLQRQKYKLYDGELPESDDFGDLNEDDLDKLDEEYLE